ncbi:hypothetical protein SAMN04488074_110185 [Lentzea albidocapillata subsp. violacea]|uniref:DUF2231 domain-containing protein n=1 Tax=Lentzea albidocapillata subsp. violacea TaxID=128104 RepID=A0A1G9J9Y1_9PSEU|nr:DUF2231 domain-containing protein [Lentzea albidocapillata]SDL34288.1 hypothetical protein SAMN04488074_110185 [Lentzea albidocapillata subsp. violacea]
MLTIDGIPLHPLLVHAVVALLPLAALSSVAIALVPAWRRRYAWPVLGVTLAGVAAVPVAKQTGEDFQAALQNNGVQNPAIQIHADLGTTLLPIALGFGVAVIALLVAGRLADRERQAEAPTTKTWRVLSVVVSVLVVLLAIGTTVQTVRAGHSGSEAVWSGVGS